MTTTSITTITMESSPTWQVPPGLEPSAIPISVLAQNFSTTTTTAGPTFSSRMVTSIRDGFGAKIEITVEGSTRYAEVRAGSTFESSSDPRAHFGLGAAARVDAIAVRWPSGQVDKLGPEST